MKNYKDIFEGYNLFQDEIFFIIKNFGTNIIKLDSFKEMADKGDVKCQLIIGCVYYFVRNTKRDNDFIKIAIKYLKKCSNYKTKNRCTDTANYILGMLYFNGYVDERKQKIDKRYKIFFIKSFKTYLIKPDMVKSAFYFNKIKDSTARCYIEILLDTLKKEKNHKKLLKVLEKIDPIRYKLEIKALKRMV